MKLIDQKRALALCAGISVRACAGFAQPSISSMYDFYTLDYPGALDIPRGSYPIGINNKREVDYQARALKLIQRAVVDCMRSRFS
jgi:hypothetical protein